MARPIQQQIPFTLIVLVSITFTFDVIYGILFELPCNACPSINTNATTIQQTFTICQKIAVHKYIAVFMFPIGLLVTSCLTILAKLALIGIGIYSTIPITGLFEWIPHSLSIITLVCEIWKWFPKDVQWCCGKPLVPF